MPNRYGSEIYTIDHKGRVSVPVALRRAGGRRSLEIVLTRGFEGCIAMYTLEQWSRFEALLNAIPYGDTAGRKFARAFYESTVGPLTPDAQGRITVPPHLLALAGLTKEAKFLPMGDRIEIWDPARYAERQQAGDLDMIQGAERYFGGPQS